MLGIYPGLGLLAGGVERLHPFCLIELRLGVHQFDDDFRVFYARDIQIDELSSSRALG